MAFNAALATPCVRWFLRVAKQVCRAHTTRVRQNGAHLQVSKSSQAFRGDERMSERRAERTSKTVIGCALDVAEKTAGQTAGQFAALFALSLSSVWISFSKAALSTMPTCKSAILPSRSISRVAGIELKPKRSPRSQFPITVG